LAIMLRKEGFEVLLADSRASAAAVLARGPVPMVITDVKLPDGDGIEILRHVKAAAPETVVIVMTAFGSTQTAVAALKLGAHDYPRAPPPPRRLVRVGQLRGPRREPPRERAVRPREGRLHRRPPGQEGPLRGRAPRHPLPRRGRRDLHRDAGEAAARPPGE